MAIPTTNLNYVIYFDKDVKVSNIINFLRSFENLDECEESYYSDGRCFVNRQKGQETRIFINCGWSYKNLRKRNVVSISPSVYKLNQHSFDFVQEVVTRLFDKFGIRVVMFGGTELDYERFSQHLAGLREIIRRQTNPVKQYEFDNFDMSNTDTILRLVTFFFQNHADAVLKILDKTERFLEQVSLEEFGKRIKESSKKYTGPVMVVVEVKDERLLVIIVREDLCTMTIDEVTKKKLEKNFGIRLHEHRKNQRRKQK